MTGLTSRLILAYQAHYLLQDHEISLQLGSSFASCIQPSDMLQVPSHLVASQLGQGS